MKAFITYIAGHNEFFPGTKELKLRQDTATTRAIRELLGTQYKGACIALYRICAAQPLVQQELGLFPGGFTMEGQGLELTGPEEAVVGTGKGPARVLPSEAPIVGSGVYMGELTLKASGPSSAQLLCGTQPVNVTAVATADTVACVWPAWLKINGALKLPTGTVWTPGYTTLPVPVRWKYPVSAVDELLRKENIVYSFLEENNLCETFYAADTAEERISIVVSALIKVSMV